MIALAFDIGSIVLADLILSGDNALIIGMAAAGLPAKLRARAIFYGMIIAALLRVIFAVIATELLGVPGLLFIGGLLLCWVCWRLYREIVDQVEEAAAGAMGLAEVQTLGAQTAPRKALVSALWTIAIADVSMSLDNVLAVAAIAQGNVELLVFGLGLAILMMAFAATLIMKLLARFAWIQWVGLAVLIYVAAEMLFRGVFDAQYGVGPLLGLIEGMDLSSGH
ncbi:MAG: TerC family protein [Alphaproteobacteria bacterium]|nr:MAG: TerC family protein [Alphaproteobacteria bacterium]